MEWICPQGDNIWPSSGSPFSPQICPEARVKQSSDSNRVSASLNEKYWPAVSCREGQGLGCSVREKILGLFPQITCQVRSPVSAHSIPWRYVMFSPNTHQVPDNLIFPSRSKQYGDLRKSAFPESLFKEPSELNNMNINHSCDANPSGWFVSVQRWQENQVGFTENVLADIAVQWEATLWNYADEIWKMFRVTVKKWGHLWCQCHFTECYFISIFLEKL